MPFPYLLKERILTRSFVTIIEQRWKDELDCLYRLHEQELSRHSTCSYLWDLSLLRSELTIISLRIILQHVLSYRCTICFRLSVFWLKFFLPQRSQKICCNHVINFRQGRRNLQHGDFQELKRHYKGLRVLICF